MRAKPVERPPPIKLQPEIKTNTESNLETEENDGLIVSNVVLLAENVLNVFLGDGGTLRVKNFNGLLVISQNTRTTI